MWTRKRDIEAVDRGEARVMQSEVEVAGLVIVGGFVAVAFIVVDFDGIENQVRLFGGNGLDVVLVAEIILLGDGEFHRGAQLLGRDVDGLSVACCHVKADDLSVGGEADGRAFVGFQLVLFVASGQYGQHGDIKFLRHFAVEFHIGIAKLMEEIVGDRLPVAFGPRGLPEEVFSGCVAKGRMNEVCGVLRPVGGHEVGPHVVVGAPNIDVVDEGIGDLSGRDESQSPVLMAVEDLGEAFVASCTAIIEPTCEAVIRHDVGKVGIG